MAYSRTTWVDGTTPALNATNLNNIEQGIVTLDTEKAPKASPTFTGTVTLPSTTSVGNVSSTEIGYLDGVTSAIQTQLNAKAPLANPTFTGTVNAATLDLTTAATSTAATAYFVETGSDGVVRPKSLANVKTEVVTTAAVNTAAATTLGTVTTGVWNATAINATYIDSAIARLASPTFTGKVTTAATSASTAGLILPPGTAPSSPVNGDVWTTTAGVYYRNGTTTQHVPRVTVASSAPASPVDGDIWVDSDPAWTDWTPSVSASTPPTVTGTAGRYARYDNIVVGWGIFSITYANRGSGGYLLSLPVAPKQRTDCPRIGFAQVGQNSQYIHMQLELYPTSNYVQLLGAPTTTWGSLKFISATDITSPNTLSVSYNFVYEAA